MIGCLFSGVGGLERGLERATGQSVAWQCEYDKDASRVLAERWPGVSNLHDITTVNWSTVEPVDILCGGPPCQPTSTAGKRKGEADDRWMWPAALDAVRHLRPRWIVFENPPALLTLDGGRPFGRILASLAQMGYVGRWGCVRASDIGAPHRRERVFIVAHANQPGLEGPEPAERRLLSAGSGRAVANAHDGEHDQREGQDGPTNQRAAAGRGQSWTPRRGDTTSDTTSAERRATESELLGAPLGPAAEHRERPSEGVSWGAYEPAIRRWEAVHGDAPVPVDDRGRLSPAFVEWMMGFPAGWVTDVAISRSAQLRCLGNAVVPQCGELAWRLLA